MNDFHMSSLAVDRIDELRAEANRHRMARAAKPQQAPSPGENSQRPRRFGFRSLLRRAAA